MTHLERLGGGPWPSLLYWLVALLAFPAFRHRLAGEHGLGYALGVFELPRTNVRVDWLANLRFGQAGVAVFRRAAWAVVPGRLVSTPR
ncbi:MAG: hypothetical protein ACJ78L_14630 [Chloroflexota bacterium]